MSPTEEDVVMKQDSVAQIYHIDGRVTAIEGRIGGVETTLSRIEQTLLNKPPVWNIGNIMALMVMVGALLVGVSTYVDMQLNNMKELMARNTATLGALSADTAGLHEFQREMHFEIGGIKSQAATTERAAIHADEMMHRLDDRVRNNEHGVAEGLAIQRNLHEHIQEIDRHGSRAWIGKTLESRED